MDVERDRAVAPLMGCDNGALGRQIVDRDRVGAARRGHQAIISKRDLSPIACPLTNIAEAREYHRRPVRLADERRGVREGGPGHPDKPGGTTVKRHLKFREANRAGDRAGKGHRQRSPRDDHGLVGRKRRPVNETTRRRRRDRTTGRRRNQFDLKAA